MVTLIITNSNLYLESIDKIASKMNESNGRILITGASGMIGSCIIDVLLCANKTYNKNFEIFALGRNERKLTDRFGTNNNVHYIVQDVIDSIEIDNLDYIIHAASNADPNSYALYPSETIITNVLGAKRILDYCKNNQTRALLTSSFEVYGKMNQDVYCETDSGIIDLNRIRSCYPESKRVAELLFKAYADEYAVDCVITRLSSVYGPTMSFSDSKAHAQFIQNALAGKDIVLKSSGSQIRSYSYLMDAVSGILKVLFWGETGEVYNIANPNSISSIAEFASIVAEYSKTNVVFEHPDEIEIKGYSNPHNCILNTKKLEELNWHGSYTLEDGIFETLEILKEALC